MTGPSRGPVAWMAGNPVAANLLMLALLIGGFLSMRGITQEIFPRYQSDTVRVSMSYPGASPEEVEEGIVLAIESEVRTVTGLKEISSSSSEGSGWVAAELVEGANPDRVLQAVRDAVGRITSFPDDAEPPRVELAEGTARVTSIAITGALTDVEMNALAERLRTELVAWPGISRVDNRSERKREISIEIPQAQLRALDLTLRDVAQAVRDAARDVPGGQIETRDGEVLLRMEGRRETALAFTDIPLKTADDGSTVLLSDVARVQEVLEDARRIVEYNGVPGTELDIYQADGQEPIALAEQIKDYVDDVNATLPADVRLEVTSNRSKRFAERMGILIGNGVAGFVLILLTLGLFLNLRLAFWVAVSIPVVFIGSFVLLPHTGVTINMISVFAFIMTLGIVVDDAIIVGENVHAKRQQGLPLSRAVVEGASDMAVPVIFAVCTNIIAFIPLMFVPGGAGQFLKALPIVASVVFLVSLIEALFILPAHLNHTEREHRRPAGRLGHLYDAVRRVGLFRDRAAAGLDRLRDGAFQRALRQALAHRYITMVIFTGLLALIAAWVASGRIDLAWNPTIPSDRVDGELEMPPDASIAETLAVTRRIEAAGLRAIDRLGGRQMLENYSLRVRRTSGDVSMRLVSDEERDFTQADFTRLWREEIGDLAGIESLFFEHLIGPGGSRGLRVRLSHPSNATLEAAAAELAELMRQYQGVVDVTDGSAEGKRQLRFHLTPEARALGLTESAVGRQLRDAFFGAEALRQLRDASEMKVMVRLPLAERQSAHDLSTFVVRAPGGIDIPLTQAVDIEPGRAFTNIRREDGRRALTVTGSIDPQQASNRRIRADLAAGPMQELERKYPGLEWRFTGGAQSRDEATDAILVGLGGVIVVIYALMASLFRNYVQGFLVVLTIPYSVAAAVAGHVIMGYDLTSVSIFGMIALCGLVVNGALVLTLRYRQLSARGADPLEAATGAAVSRFRPIVLTSLTTAVGLTPMLFETSVQALFLVPMAIALSFGTVFSAFVVLFAIPALHLMHDDARRLLRPAAAPTATADADKPAV